MRFAVRAAVPGDADGIARAHTASWHSSYRGILPERVLAHMSVDQRAVSWRRVIEDRAVLTLVAYDTTHHDIVGVCDAGRNRSNTRHVAEVYRLYLEHHAKRHGLGSEMLDRVFAWLRGQQLGSVVIWVLDDNHHARRFYEARGGQPAGRMASNVAGHPVLEVAYGWDL